MTSLRGCIAVVLVFLAANAAMLPDYAGLMFNTSRFLPCPPARMMGAMPG